MMIPETRRTQYIVYLHFYYLSEQLFLIDFDFIFIVGATFSKISAILWRPVLVVEEAGVPGESHRPWASNW